MPSQALALTSPGVVLTGLRAPLESTLAGQQGEDRPATAAAGEVLAGLMASGAAHAVPTGKSAAGAPASAWDEWLGPLVKAALDGAPLDQVPAWASGVVRYSAHELAAVGKFAELEALARLLAAPSPPGASFFGWGGCRLGLRESAGPGGPLPACLLSS